MIKPRTAPGVLELLPREQVAFQRFLDTIRQGYERFGFLPIETPAFEFVDILLTKSGGDTEKQVYFVQSTGARDQNKPPDLALRFDLTVPLARYVAEHEHELVFPFRRYQMQRVYRGERAQKGRFREFYQCDIDVIGKDTLPLAFDAEFPAVIDHVFRSLDVGDFVILLNNRKLLRGILAIHDIDDARQPLVLREIDKLDKVGIEEVAKSLCSAELNLPPAMASRLLELLAFRGSVDEVLRKVSTLNFNDSQLQTGLHELRFVVEMMTALGVSTSRIQIDLSIARGLDYYTGTIYETRLVKHPEIGSICSGGRYDDLASHYSKSKLPGVGISIGATRLFDQLRQVQALKSVSSPVSVYVAQVDPSCVSDCLALAAELRAAGVNTELAPEPGKLAKQFKYADRSGIECVAVYGGDEKAKGVVAVKDLKSGSQFDITRADIASHFVNRVKR